MPESNVKAPEELTEAEIIECLDRCASGADEACDVCPYNRDPYEDGCGKLLADSAALLKAKRDT